MSHNNVTFRNIVLETLPDEVLIYIANMEPNVSKKLYKSNKYLSKTFSYHSTCMTFKAPLLKLYFKAIANILMKKVLIEISKKYPGLMTTII
jgi:hypothetical protein